MLVVVLYLVCLCVLVLLGLFVWYGQVCVQFCFDFVVVQCVVVYVLECVIGIQQELGCGVFEGCCVIFVYVVVCYVQVFSYGMGVGFVVGQVDEVGIKCGQVFVQVCWCIVCWIDCYEYYLQVVVKWIQLVFELYCFVQVQWVYFGVVGEVEE